MTIYSNLTIYKRGFLKLQSITQIKVGKHNTGIVGFDDALEEAAGPVPSKAKLKEYISQAAFELKNQQGVC